MPYSKTGSERSSRQVAHEIIKSMRRRARKKGFARPEFTIDEIETQLLSGKCAVTNRSFDHKYESKYAKNPFNMSADRIDNNKGYTKKNVRFVCWWVNAARGIYSIEDFTRWMRGVRWK